MRRNNKISPIFVLFIVIVVGVMLFAYSGFAEHTHVFVEGSGEELIDNVIDVFDEGGRCVIIDRGTNQELNYLVDRIYDEPNLYWVDMQYNALSLGNISVLVLREKYNDLEKIETQIELAADDVISKYIKNDMSDYDKVLAIHDWLCANVTYGESKNDSDQDIYGALVLGKARCAGYAKAFAYLLNKAGVKSSVISGDSIDENGESVPHAWNIVYIDGDPYYFDITWDDGDEITYDWFGITSQEFKMSHFPNIGYEWVEAKNTGANYYIKNRMYLSEYSAIAIANQIQTQGLSFQIKCANRDVLNETIESFGNRDLMQKVMEIVGIKRIEQIAYSENPYTNCLHVEIKT